MNFNSFYFYSAQAADTEEKCEELKKAVETLQSLVKEATERYGSLEAAYEQDKSEYKGELVRRNDAIRALKKELDDANVLLKTMKQKGELCILTFGRYSF